MGLVNSVEYLLTAMELSFPVKVTYSARGIPSYRCEISHPGLHEYAAIKASDPDILKNKALAQLMKWQAAWEKLTVKERVAGEVRSLKDAAAARTESAQKILDDLRRLLCDGIQLDLTIDWDQRKQTAPFPTPPIPAPEPTRRDLPRAPELSDFKYRVNLSILDRLVPSRRLEKKNTAKHLFEDDMVKWRQACDDLAKEDGADLDAYHRSVAQAKAEHATALTRWNSDRAAYQEEQKQQHNEIDRQRIEYEARQPEAVMDYCERVLTSSEYPDFVPREFEFDFFVDTGILVVNSRLPAPEDLPRLAEVKYIKTTDSLSEKFLSDAQSTRLYDEAIYQITLRTIYELFQSDSVRAINSVVFNGIVTSTDRATGNEATACIVSVQAGRDAFMVINLAKVDPKACFRQLKGVGSSKLHSVTPIAPIIELQREDRRFVPSHDVIDTMNTGQNLAIMDWEDFEHLIREIFEKEFSSSGGEVKVTQASRDGGVDAVAFDPDPIRGGKIVIQAKRYAYTVGVSAVRDLYGTVMNEGASKGILVTTSDYGPDAYEFARGKPLSLLSGANLLHLLAKHGVTAHINLGDARKIAHERATRATQ